MAYMLSWVWSIKSESNLSNWIAERHFPSVPFSPSLTPPLPVPITERDVFALVDMELISVKESIRFITMTRIDGAMPAIGSKFKPFRTKTNNPLLKLLNRRITHSNGNCHLMAWTKNKIFRIASHIPQYIHATSFDIFIPFPTFKTLRPAVP